MGTLRHVRALDGLRGLAVAAVLLFHGGYLKGGFLGVDLFFVLSGFLITSLLLAEARERGRIDLGHFWARRARRLLPALGLLLAGVALYALVLARPDELHRIRFDGLASAFYFANWRAVFATQTYWELFAKPSPLQHTWSLAIEEQFYVLWPLLLTGVLAWCSRRQRLLAPRVLALCGVLTLASLVAMYFAYVPGDTNRAYYGTDTRAASILIGAGLAALIAWRGHATSTRAWRAMQLLAVGGAAVLAVEWIHLDGTSSAIYRGGLLLGALAAIAIIAAVAHPQRGPVHRALEVAPLVGLGIISYGVYLWHWPVFVVLDPERVHLTGWPLFGVRVLVTLAIAIASYAVVEHPIRRGALSAVTWRRLTPAIAAVVVIALVTTTTGFKTPASAAGETEREQPEAVLATAPASAQRVMIVGNSVAYLLADGFKALTPDPPIVVLNGAVAACIFPDGVTKVRNQLNQNMPVALRDCDAYWAADVERFRPDVVVFTLGDFGDGDVQRNGQWIHPCTPEYDEWFRSSLRNAVRALGATGARVALTTSAYTIGVIGGTHYEKNDCINNMEREIAASSPNAMVVDLATHMCPTHECVAEQDGVVLREDGLHYRGEAARIIAGWILGQIRQK